MAERWELDRLAAQFGADYDLVVTAEGVAAVPHETGRDTLRAHSPLVLAVLLAQAGTQAARGESPLGRCQRENLRVQDIHAARAARR